MNERPYASLDGVEIDEEIFPLVSALRSSPAILTMGSCCGHGRENAYVDLAVEETAQAPSCRVRAGTPGRVVTTMRLYRGLTKPYRADKVLKPGQSMTGTDFTDCPFTALRYAQGASGVLLVIDIDAESPRVTEELWVGMSVRRFMVWGSFDGFIAGAVQAKALRALVRKKGIVTYDDSVKARILKEAIEEKLHYRRRVGAPSPIPPPVASYRS